MIWTVLTTLLLLLSTYSICCIIIIRLPYWLNKETFVLVHSVCLQCARRGTSEGRGQIKEEIKRRKRCLIHHSVLTAGNEETSSFACRVTPTCDKDGVLRLFPPYMSDTKERWPLTASDSAAWRLAESLHSKKKQTCNKCAGLFLINYCAVTPFWSDCSAYLFPLQLISPSTGGPHAWSPCKDNQVVKSSSRQRCKSIATTRFVFALKGGKIDTCSFGLSPSSGCWQSR